MLLLLCLLKQITKYYVNFWFVNLKINWFLIDNVMLQKKKKLT